MIGKVVSHYEILEKLGEGGMGVVYKAEDLKLTRTVALKFLPQGMHVHEHERARFLQEARAAAILNHPNICTIYDIAEEGGEQFIVMEYVEGKTLRVRIGNGGLKIEDGIGYAIQIAEALQEAHSHGIVHRDIKADNIMVNTKNQIKVMDFGLAKLKGSLKLTKTSSTVGTLAYMSPEQVEGQEVDPRSDIFSFGIVLYEMLTGHLPFRGEHEAAMMYSILNEEPDPLQRYLPGAQSELVHVLDRALEKDRENRYQSVHEMLIDLRRIKKVSEKLLPTPSRDIVNPESVAPVSNEGKRKKRNALLWTALALLAILCVVAAFLFIPRTSAARLNPNRTSVSLKTPFKEFPEIAMSQDGNWAAFSTRDENGKQDVYWMNIAGGKPGRLTQEYAESMGGIDLSPDASSVTYSPLNEPYGVYTVKIAPTQGGGSRTLADTGTGPKWTLDGQRIGYIRNGTSGLLPSVSGKLEIWSVTPDGRDRRLELVDSLAARPSPWAWCWAPDGKSIVWARNYPGTHGELMVRELVSGKERQLTFDRKYIPNVTWASNGQIFFASNKSGQNNLWMIPATGGEAVQVTVGAAPIRDARISGDNKTLVLKQMESVRHIWISALDGSNAREVSSDDVRVVDARLSPDGRQIAHIDGDPDWSNWEAHLYIMDRDGRNARQLTFGPEIVSTCEWSPDGRFLAYSSRSLSEPMDSARVFLIRPDSPGSPRLLYPGAGFFWVDNQRMVVYLNEKTYLRDISGAMPIQVCEDSTEGRPILGGSQLFYFDSRKGKEGWWVGRTDPSGKMTGMAKKLLPLNRDVVVYPEEGLLYYTGEQNNIWKMQISTGKEERIGTVPPRLSISDVNLPRKEILWRELLYPSKLVLVKDVFE